jgi:hypothetical protein
LGKRAKVRGAKMRRLVVALVLLTGCLTALGIWLDQEFDASRGPSRGVNPDFIVTLSLVLVGLVVVLWGLAWYQSVRASDGNRR